MAPIEKVIGQVVVITLGVGAGYVCLRNIIAKRRWLGRALGQFIIGLVIALLTMRLFVMTGFRGWWIEYIGYGVGFFAAYSVIAPITVQEWNQGRRRDVPRSLRKKVIERHIRLTGSYDPSREHIDHVYPFAKGGGHTGDNLHVIPKDENQRKRDSDPHCVDWMRADYARCKDWILSAISR